VEAVEVELKMLEVDKVLIWFLLSLPLMPP
jgi:hypothetical protein